MVCLATPVSVAASLLSEAFPAFSHLLAKKWRQVNGGIAGRGSPSGSDTATLAVNHCQKMTVSSSVVSRDTVPDPTYRGFTFHFKPVAG